MKPFWIVAAGLTLIIFGAVCAEAMWGSVESDFAMFWRADNLAYPPPYLLFIKPFSLLPYGPAFIAWTALTGALYVAASPRPREIALANPAATYCGMVGQSSFLAAAMLFVGLRDLAHRPVRGGAILGLLVIKPHLAVALPVAVIAGRIWRAVPAALASATALSVLALVAFGPAAFWHWFHLDERYGHLLQAGAWQWDKLASSYALARWFGASTDLAWSVQALVAIAALSVVWIAWRQDLDGKVPLTAAASLLVSPYLFTYDAVLLTPALAWVRPRDALIIWALAVVPLIRVFTGPYWPSTIPLAAAVSVCAVLAAERRPLKAPRKRRAATIEMETIV